MYQIERKDGNGWQPISKKDAAILLRGFNQFKSLRNIGRYTHFRTLDWTLRRNPQWGRK